GPHAVAEVALDLAGDGGNGVTLEGPAGRVEPVDGLHQPEGRDLAQVLHGLAAVTEAAGDAVGHGQPRGDELVADGVPLRSVPQRGQAGEEGGGVRGVVVPPAGGGWHGGGSRGTGGRGVNVN